jgi:uncharacterized protein YndB with AHSA1/START domain
MEMIRHRVGIRAPRSTVHTNLTTLDGLASWWTNDVTGDPGPGGKIEFRFGPGRGCTTEVMEATAERVVWRVVSGPDEWLDTVITYNLSEDAGETVLMFTHAWREPVDFMFHCSTKWGYFLLSLKAATETGAGTPFPTDLQISSWG